jgi:hypothetical protein
MEEFYSKEECLEINGNHYWYDLPVEMTGCLIYHEDGYCTHNDRRQKCALCPAKRRYTRVVAPKWDWVDQ